MSKTIAVQKIKQDINEKNKKIKDLQLDLDKTISQLTFGEKKELILDYLRQKKQNNGGTQTVNILELIIHTKLPAKDINLVMKKLESKGIREINE